jgi:ubiquinone biosynthesis protein
MRWLLLLLRALHISLLIGLHGLIFIGGWLRLRLASRPRDERLALLGRCALRLFRALGATFIKVGQLLSTRGDLIPGPVRTALRELQDRVGPFPYAKVRHALHLELGNFPERIFTELDPYPVASASVSQVHRGRLPDGTEVAVKVLRPNIEATVRVDLQVIRIWARLLGLLPWLRHFDPRGIVDEFAHAVWAQLDLRIEAANNRRFTENFAGDPSVFVPRLVESLCTERVLCMEFVHGSKLLGPGWDPSQGERLAQLGCRVLLQMIFVDGFVHADLHPGNLIIVGRGSTAGSPAPAGTAPDGERLYLVDLGLTASLSPERRQGLVRLFSAWAAHDSERVAQVMLELAGAAPADPEAFRQTVHGLVDRYRTAALAEVQLGLVFLELARVLRRQRVRLDPALTMILVAIAVVEGVGREVAPQLDLVREALSFFTTRGAAALG